MPCRKEHEGLIQQEWCKVWHSKTFHGRTSKRIRRQTYQKHHEKICLRKFAYATVRIFRYCAYALFFQFPFLHIPFISKKKTLLNCSCSHSHSQFPQLFASPKAIGHKVYLSHKAIEFSLTFVCCFSPKGNLWCGTSCGMTSVFFQGFYDFYMLFCFLCQWNLLYLINRIYFLFEHQSTFPSCLLASEHGRQAAIGTHSSMATT